jgi:hypothetical protein
MDRKELSFLVGGKRTGPKVRNLEGEFYPAVFISGDEGDCVAIVKGEAVKAQVRRSLSKMSSPLRAAVTGIGLVSAPSSPLRGAVQVFMCFYVRVCVLFLCGLHACDRCLNEWCSNTFE